MTISRGARLGRELRELNRQAYCYRYAMTCPPYEADRTPFALTFKDRAPLQMYQAARCWLYQCSEGDQFTQSDLYRTVDGAMQRLAAKIVSDLIDMTGVPWGE